MTQPLPCYHCGEPVPAGSRWCVTILGEQRDMCCPGCQAVAEAIVAGGLESYYSHRTERSINPEALPRTLQDELEMLDRSDVQQRYVQSEGDRQNIQLLIEGISCAACGWLIERRLRQAPGVVEAARAMGASRWRIVWSVLIPETLGPLILAFTFLVIAVIDMSAMAGYIGGGGIGDFAIVYGYRAFDTEVTYVRSWFDHPLFIETNASHVRAARERLPPRLQSAPGPCRPGRHSRPLPPRRPPRAPGPRRLGMRGSPRIPTTAAPETVSLNSPRNPHRSATPKEVHPHE